MIPVTVPLPCIVSDWTEWSKPDATGSTFRWRFVTRPSLNGGKECPDLIQSRKGMLAYHAERDQSILMLNMMGV